MGEEKVSTAKKIALIGNVNNNFFAVTRHLRDRGYDAHLFYRASMDHFQPKADTFSLDYIDFCHEIKWLDKGFACVPEREVVDQLTGFDFYIGQGDEAAVAHSCGFNMDVYYPYGSDIYKYAHLPQKYSLKTKLLSKFRKGKGKLSSAQLKKGPIAKYLRGAILSAKNVFLEYTYKELEDRIKELNYRGNYQHIATPFIYLKEYETVRDWDKADVHWRTIINNIRSNNDFILLYHGRQEWKTYHNDFTIKNTHHVIYGFANFIRKNPKSKAALVMIEYGTDVEFSKQLVNDLGISAHVKWLPKMYRKDLMCLIHNADLCCGEFGVSNITFGTIIEAMQMKKPVINYREDSLYVDKYPYLYPLYNARSPEEIENAIAHAAANPEKAKEMGEKAYIWMRQFFIEKPLEILQSVIEGKIKHLV